METLRAEIDGFQSAKLAASAALQQEVDRKSIIIDELQGTVNNLDLQIDNLNRLLEDKDVELHDERQISENLRNCLDSRFEDDNGTREQLEEALEDLKTKEEEISSLRDQLRELEEGARFREQALESQLADQEVERAAIKDQAATVQADVQSSIAFLQKRLDAVDKEKSEIISSLNAFKEKCVLLENDNREKVALVAASNKDTARMVEYLQFYRNRLDLQMETLVKQTEMWFDSFNGRVASISGTLNSRHNQVYILHSCSIVVG